MAEDRLAQASELLRAHPLVDGHNDLPWALRAQAFYDLDRLDPSRRLESTQTDFPRLREGGVGAQFWSVYVPSNLPGHRAVTATLEQIDCVHQLLARYRETLGLATTAEEVRSVFASGRIASLLGAEGGQSIGASMGALRCLYALGVRYMTLTHNDNNPWADSATDEPRLGGLAPFGRQVVLEMNRLGMLVDLSHVSPGTMADALETTEAPVIFSHSSARALVAHPRNVPDDILERLATNGGVCMVTFVPDFVSAECHAWSEQLAGAMREEGLEPRDWSARMRFAAAYAAKAARPSATVSQVADHVERVRSVAGVEAVGIGGDYDGCDAFPVGLEDVSGYPRLFAELAERGWSPGELAGLAGGNVLRVLREAESVARRARKDRAPSLARMEE
ncbi:MAG TPA: dipeptidase [Acidimicrobiales bacterium]|nr:dipeptidase [Acidimicrobiales bacterium]